MPAKNKGAQACAACPTPGVRRNQSGHSPPVCGCRPTRSDNLAARLGLVVPNAVPQLCGAVAVIRGRQEFGHLDPFFGVLPDRSIGLLADRGGHFGQSALESLKSVIGQRLRP